VRIRYAIGLGFVGLASLSWLALAIIAMARGRKISKCPRCQSTRIRYSWPRFADKFLYFTNITPYRCEACTRRFYAMKRRRVVSSVH
jgi:transposase-like protein